MRRLQASEYQYGSRTSAEVRCALLQLTLEFVLGARVLPGVERIALLGSLATDKAYPKDADVLVSIGNSVAFDKLARQGRRFAGRAQGISSGSDVFLADSYGEYLGRVCHYRVCHPRVLCRARHCGARQHLCDDLRLVRLTRDVIAAPPVILHPELTVSVAVPADVATILLAPLGKGSGQATGQAGIQVGAI